MLPLLFLWGCDESLPPRNDPVQVLKASLHGISHEVVFDSLQVNNGGIAFLISVDNQYDEVLQGDALIRGTLDVEFLTSPALHGEIAVDARFLENDQILRDGIITLGVDSGAAIYPRWDHEVPSGTPVWQHFVMHRKVNNKGEIYYESDSIHVIAQGTMQIFKNVQPTRLPPLQWTLIYRVYGLTELPSLDIRKKPSPRLK